MSEAPTKPALPKGHIRCFGCGQTCQAFKGAWHEKQDRQIFLCASCEPRSVSSQPSKAVINPKLV